jgi:hypothetical protein
LVIIYEALRQLSIVKLRGCIELPRSDGKAQKESVSYLLVTFDLKVEEKADIV